MPELVCGDSCWSVTSGANLLDALNQAGMNVPFSCRAGSCHACLVRCVTGVPLDARPDALDATQHAQGWRLACQSQVVEDLTVAAFDPACDGLPAKVHSLDWLDAQVLRLRLVTERPLRYRAGQHLLIWNGEVARPYSLASLPGEDPWLEFHIDCRQPGAFCNLARGLLVGDALQLGQLYGGALHYEPDWQARPLLLLAGGTGLAPLWGILRDALRQGHQGPIRVLHFASDQHYLRGPLSELARQHGNLQLEWIGGDQARSGLQALRVVSRQEIALVCGGAGIVEACCKRLFLAGVPRGQVLSDVFAERNANDAGG